ncbi:MAG: RcnB family protein [Proteobacteria bacterium]|nr:RcnB family protein [Pseudomonadota bacterium]
MAVRNVTLTSRRAVLALATAVVALPGVALAEPVDGRGGNPAWGQRGGERGEQIAERGNRGGGNQGGNGWSNRAAVPAQTQAPAPTPSWAGRAANPQNNGDQARGWGGRSGGNWQGQPAAPAAQPTPRWNGNQGGARDGDRRDGWTGDRRADWQNRDGERWRGNNQARDNDQWRGQQNRDQRWRDNNQSRYNDQWRGQQNRDQRWRGNNPSWAGNQYRGNSYRNWDRRWRDNDRYDWRSYRRYNPSVYRWGTYYAPYRDYSYRRLSIGFFLDTMFFGSNYWINDPWQYRLPDVYGPYRWVRYYDDALLVNVYNGEVVDAIYGFFW